MSARDRLRRGTRNVFECVGAVAWIGIVVACSVGKAIDDRLQDPEERARRARNDARAQRLNDAIIAKWEAEGR